MAGVDRCWLVSCWETRVDECSVNGSFFFDLNVDNGMEAENVFWFFGTKY